MTYKIGMFDSGVGGLSLAKPMLSILDDAELLYVADNLKVPYGNKSEQEVLQRCQSLCAFFVEQGCDLIVFACNTATAIAVDSCRELFELPIVAMEPAVKPAAQRSKSQSIAVCATDNTLKQPRFERLIAHYASGVEVHRVACHEWVQLVESGMKDRDKAKAIIKADLESALESGADKVVLGCTHFPLLMPLIKEVVSDKIEVIDPALAVVQVIKDYYHNRKNSEKSRETLPVHRFFYTDSTANYAPLVRQYCASFSIIEFKEIGLVPLTQTELAERYLGDKDVD